MSLKFFVLKNMIIKIEGIVTSERSHGETSKIINILTKDKGVIGIMAKGARNLKSEYRANTSKLTQGFFNISYKENGLSNLISVDLIENFKNIKKDIVKISYASYLIELATQVMNHNETEEIYDLLIASLKKIDENYNPAVITNILELKYLDFLGVMPIIDSCSICGSKNSIATISADKGGYVCNNCLTNEKLVNDKTIKLIRMFYYVDISKISNLNISDNIIKEINMFLDNYYDRYTGLYLRSKQFLKNLNKVN